MEDNLGEVIALDFPMVDSDLRMMLKWTSQLSQSYLHYNPIDLIDSAKPLAQVTVSRAEVVSHALGVDVC